jgi:uncharacterized membrane protein
MARPRKTGAESLEQKIEQAMQTEELMKAIAESDKTFEEIMEFIGKDEE